MATNIAPQSGEVHQNLEFINMKKVINFTYTWNVNYFERRYCSYQSPIFSNETDNEIKWRFKMEKLMPGQSSVTGAKPVYFCAIFTETYSVQLGLISSNVNKMQCNCKFQLLSAIPTNIRTHVKSIQFTPEEYSHCFTENEDVLLLSSNRYLQNGHLKINCRINVLEISTLLIMPQCSLIDNFKLMFENQNFSDVTLCVSGKEFRAHKAILVARSPVFNAMFKNEMKEKKTNQVDITDINGEAFEELLRFIYTGKVSNLEKFANDLLPAAEKYGFEKLKVLCGKEICSNISIENASEVLVLTDMYNLDQLKAVVIGYIGTNVADVCKTTGWISMAQSHPNLITEVLCDVSKQFQDKIAYYES